MREPDDVLGQLGTRFERDYPDWARGKGTWPLRISLHPPTPRQRSADPVACHAWAARWAVYEGPGTVDHTRLRFPTGTHAMPRTLILDRPREVAAALPVTRATWTRCGDRLTRLQHEFPDARFSGVIRRMTELTERDYQRLVDTAAWLKENPTSDRLLRQLPIEGIDTKWLSRHAALVLALIGEGDDGVPPAEDAASGSTRRRLHERLGLRLPPELIQVAVLDPELRSRMAGMRHFATSREDLERWPRHPRVVIILENKETGYAITDDQADTVVLHGQGFNIADYARISWVRNARAVFYWGDIDAPGLQFVSDLRGRGVPARSLLMDLPTLERFRHLAVKGTVPRRSVVPHLTDAEAALYRHLVHHAAKHGAGLLLEQERIPWPHAHSALTNAIRKADQMSSGS
nr:DUF3322 and DUF2220 domain-containing protein [Actinomadura rugatobispora]